MSVPLPANPRYAKLFAFAVIFGVLGGVVVLVTKAATPTAELEAESGTRTANATVVTDSTASGNGAVKFTATTSPPVGGPWPSASNTGLLVSTTRTISGADVSTAAFITANGFSGSGTASNPYLIDRVHFTDGINFGSWDAGDTDLNGKYMKFTNCLFEAQGSNPTEGGSRIINAFSRPNNLLANITITDSTIHPNAALMPTGGPDPAVGGVDQAVVTRVPLTLLRNNIWGGAILVMFAANNTGPNLVQDNYIHDVWSSAGDHTDVINGNPSASQVTVRHNYIDGIRTGNTYVANCFGIYDDNGAISDWTIDNNYVDRCATMVLSSNDTARFADPFVVTNNVFTTRYSTNLWAARTPSLQSGNKNENGVPLNF